jgi:hypothetical protein
LVDLERVIYIFYFLGFFTYFIYAFSEYIYLFIYIYILICLRFRCKRIHQLSARNHDEQQHVGGFGGCATGGVGASSL